MNTSPPATARAAQAPRERDGYSGPANASWRIFAATSGYAADTAGRAVRSGRADPHPSRNVREKRVGA